MHLRDLTPSDVDAAAALWHASGVTRPWNPPAADLHRALVGSTSTVLGAFDGDRLAGTAMVGHDGHRGWIYHLAVDASERGTGLGARLMDAAEEWLRDRGVVKVQVMVRSTNEAVLGFYDHLGYRDEDVRVRSKWLENPPAHPGPGD